MLVEELDSVAAAMDIRPRVVLINDGSTEPLSCPFLAAPPRALASVEVLNLYRNCGHQRAICIAITHVYHENSTDAVVIMDADGEDAPRDIPALIDRFFVENSQKVVFAARARRMEGVIFRFFYQMYRAIHRVLVGFDIRFGNFSILPFSALATLVRSGDLWNHYAACTVKSKLPIASIPIERAKRLKGKSKMNFPSLLVHGLSAMSVYNETISARILVALCVLFCGGVVALCTVVFIRMATQLAIAGWATMASGVLLLLLFEILIIGLLVTFGVLAARGSRAFLPLQDCPHFVVGVKKIYGDD